MAAMLLMVASAAQAGDAAARRIIGFSPDGTYFAFEQYGTLDAGASDSGWSEIDIIDTRTDEFVGGKRSASSTKPRRRRSLSIRRGHRLPRRRRRSSPNMP
ncbi:hypothetical protein [Mesorhizobium sp.]|uniref:hypothetical protein n=1 Tax=Mesorhizobium sp. TaxID=1871066 RepID=UPI00257DA46F|nr:hypothetical protein [Mesorhizobium sp.]